MKKFYLLFLLTFSISNICYSDDLELSCEGSGCNLADFYLRSIGSSRKEALNILNESYAETFRNSLQRSVLLKNSIKLSSPKLLDNYVFGFDFYGFYSSEDVKLNINKYRISSYYEFGGIYPRVYFALPIDNEGTEFWSSFSYFYGPTDVWLGISEGSTTNQAVSTNFEFKKALINYDDIFYSSLSLMISLSREKSTFVRGNSNFNKLPVNWNGDYIINYDVFYYGFPFYLSNSLHYKSLYFEQNAGAILGNLNFNDYFAANGIAGPVLNQNDFYDLNISSKKQYNKFIIEPSFNSQILYSFDHIKIGVIYQPSYDLKIHSGSIRIMFE